MTFDLWWDKYAYVPMEYEEMYTLCHGAFEFGLQTMFERKQKEIEELKEQREELLDYKAMYEKLCD